MNIRSTIAVILAYLALAAAPAFPAERTAADTKPSRSEEEFCRLDLDKDRKISYEEFASCEFYRLEHARKLPFVDMNRFPKDENGNVPEEYVKKHLFDRADKNKDRKIDRKEWEEFYNSVTQPYPGVSSGGQ
jgi:Ca2+-binding EF-hand superfamily protein